MTYELEPIKVSYHPVKLGGHRHFGSEDIMISVCHVILQDHVIKGSCDFMTGAHQNKLPFYQVCWHRHSDLVRVM